jgi:uncharacterized membrane protein YraQ (UPF0718 family)
MRPPADRQPLGLRQILWWIVGLVLLAGVGVLILTSPNDPGVMLGILRTRFLGIFIEAAPFLIIGAVVSGMIEVFVTREDIVRLVPRNPLLAPFAGAFLGFIFPVCECGVVPVTRRLFTKGLPMSVGIAFLLAAPVMNPIVLVSTSIAFGFGSMLIARFAVTLIVAVAVGVIFALAARPQDVLRLTSLAPVSGGSVDVKPVTPRGGPNRLLRVARASSDEFFDMGRYLVIGSLLAALMQTFVSQEFLLALGEGPLASVLLMQALAFVLSVCSTVDSFLALAFVGTFSSGSILAFLTFGPMIDIKSTLMFAGVFKPRTVAYLIALPMLMTLLIGLWVNLFNWL